MIGRAVRIVFLVVAATGCRGPVVVSRAVPPRDVDAAPPVVAESVRAAIPPDPVPAPEKLNPSISLVLHETFGADPEAVWIGHERTVAFVRFGGMVGNATPDPPLPAAARAAAEGARIVTGVQLWTVDGKTRALTRGARFLDGVGPLDCDFEDCSHPFTKITLDDSGRIDVKAVECPAAKAPPLPATNDTYVAFDRAIAKMACDKVGSSQLATGEGSLLRGDDAANRLFMDLIGDDRTSDQSVIGDIPVSAIAFYGMVAVVRAIRDVDLAVPLSKRSGAAKADYELWSSTRALHVVQLWLATKGTFRRLVEIPVALAPIAEAPPPPGQRPEWKPYRVVELVARIEEGSVVIGRDPRCSRPHEGLDGVALKSICGHAGTWKWRKNSFVRTGLP